MSSKEFLKAVLEIYDISTFGQDYVELNFIMAELVNDSDSQLATRIRNYAYATRSLFEYLESRRESKTK